MDSEKLLAYSTRKSPGDGVTKAMLSREPLATEGEATPGPDDVNPFLQMEDREQLDVGSGDESSEPASDVGFGFRAFGNDSDDMGPSFGFDF